MSKSSVTSTDEPVMNQAEKDLCDYLSERSELFVRFEETESERERRYDWLPVARTEAGTQAEMSDFPSGKSNDRGNFSKKTFRRNGDTVNDFLQSQDVTDLTEVEPRDISRWNQCLQRRNYARTTRNRRLQTLETFFKWAEAEWRAPTGEKTISGTIKRKRDSLDVSAEEKSRSGDDNYRISTEKAEEIIGHLAKHDYASREMVEFLLVYHTGCRISALLSINCSDINPRDNIIQIRNRPEQIGVRLKKGNKGERDVNVSNKVMSVVTDYIDEHRSEPQDDTDALLTSWSGRIDESTVYRDITDLTKCGDCTNESGKSLTKQNACNCPESIGCHDLRRVAITRMRDKGIDWDTISGRVNSTVKMLKEHYDSPTYEQAAERRKQEILNAL